MPKVFITASLTGGLQTKAANPNLPEQPHEIAKAAYDAYNEGGKQGLHKIINFYSSVIFKSIFLAICSPLFTEILTAGCVIPILRAASVALRPDSFIASFRGI